MEAFNQANILFIDENYAAAVEVSAPETNQRRIAVVIEMTHNLSFITPFPSSSFQKYNSAASSLGDFAPLYACRSAAHLKLKLFSEALEDSNKTLSLDPSHEPSFFRKGYIRMNVSLSIL